ncbi:MAG: hypothetical protein WA966_10010 [Ornithinimicrobium sp.]
MPSTASATSQGIPQAGVELQVIPGRAMFTRNQLLNKGDRILDDLTPAELALEARKQF